MQEKGQVTVFIVIGLVILVVVGLFTLVRTQSTSSENNVAEAARKAKTYSDVDLLIVVTQENFPNIKRRIEEKNKVLIKKIHPVFQAPNDLPGNIKKKDLVIVDAIRTGIVLKGWTKFVEVIANVTNK